MSNATEGQIRWEMRMTTAFGNTEVISYLVKAVSVDKWGLESDWFCLIETGRRESEQRE